MNFMNVCWYREMLLADRFPCRCYGDGLHDAATLYFPDANPLETRAAPDFGMPLTKFETRGSPLVYRFAVGAAPVSSGAFVTPTGYLRYPAQTVGNRGSMRRGDRIAIAPEALPVRSAASITSLPVGIHWEKIIEDQRIAGKELFVGFFGDGLSWDENIVATQGAAVQSGAAPDTGDGFCLTRVMFDRRAAEVWMAVGSNPQATPGGDGCILLYPDTEFVFAMRPGERLSFVIGDDAL